MASRERRTAAARIAAHTSWARTVDRAARTAPATAASPVSVDYWIARLAAERDYASEADLVRAAENARSAEMRRRALAAAASRRRNKAARQQEAARLAASA